MERKLRKVWRNMAKPGFTPQTLEGRIKYLRAAVNKLEAWIPEEQQTKVEYEEVAGMLELANSRMVSQNLREIAAQEGEHAFRFTNAVRLIEAVLKTLQDEQQKATQPGQYHVIVSHEPTSLGVKRLPMPVTFNYTEREKALEHAARLSRAGLVKGRHFTVSLTGRDTEKQASANTSESTPDIQK